MPGGGADAFAELEYLLEGVQVALGHRGVDLELHAFGLEVLDASHGGFERTGHAAEGVVAGGVRTVDGDGTALEAGFLDLAGFFGRDAGAVGRHHTAQALVAGVGGQFVHVGAQGGFAAGEDDDGAAHFREGVDEGLGFGVAQLARIGFGMGFGAAVLAGEVAGAGDFPGHEAALGRAVGQEAVGMGMRTGMTAGVSALLGAGMAGRHAAEHGFRIAAERVAAGMAGAERTGMTAHQRTQPSRRASTAK